jgi:hypothetical protein
MPPVESTLVCKEIKQRTQCRTLNDGKNKRIFSFKSFLLLIFYIIARFTTAIVKANQERILRS